ncbi:MAG TPA: hemerythrin domain-containing protein [Ideonella sp.]|uniref:hemerythrin domain-containing protein n=1 Tax=Ideonella sp. TaxID=1929293 RepID=UPI002E36DE72|nr:hemerythrin domain-containing protein [Ideonella sp.]HEX5685634.1 hemerythrin domain-containing protein [Ideonella sp.]
MASPLTLHAAPAAGFDQPFELLAACHDRVRRSLELLQRLIAHAEQQGPDAQAADAALDVLRYFGIAAPLHHEDEERHVLPLLLASEQAVWVEAAEQMAADHRTFRALWADLAPGLQVLAEQGLPQLPVLRRLAESFVALHASHLALEDKVAFPAAAQLASEAERRAMTADMAARRGVTPR